MGRTSGRDAEETRAQVLRGAAELIVARGLSVSMDEVARHTGLSKGGVMYHFPSKDELLRALARHVIEEFRQEVTSCIDEKDDEPGKLARAYIRASVDPETSQTVAQDRYTLTTLLGTVPAVQELWREDIEWWTRTMDADGLPTAVLDVVVAASDGASAATVFWGTPLSAARTAALRDRLVEMTRMGGAGGTSPVDQPQIQKIV